MSSEDVRNETLQEQATPETQNPGDVTMGEKTNQDQHTADHNPEPQNPEKENGMEKEKKGTRTPYDGSKDHGVVAAKLVTVEAAKSAKIRLQLRANFLDAQYEENASIAENSEISMSDRIPAAKEAQKTNEQLAKLDLVVKAVNAKIPELEEKEKDVVLTFSRVNKVVVTK